MPKVTFSASSVLDYIKYILGILIREHGPIYALGAICIIIIFSIFFKNLFLYLSLRVLGPMRNRVLNRLRSDLFAKILDLPLGFFTEQRKGDLISRMSNDINEIEWSVVSTLEGVFREPLTILVILFTLVFSKSAVIHFLIRITSSDGLYHRPRQSFAKKTIQYCPGAIGFTDVHIG